MAESKITRHLIWRFFPRQYGCPVLIWESRIRNLRVDGQPPNDSAEESAWAASTPDVLDHIGRVTAGCESLSLMAFKRPPAFSVASRAPRPHAGRARRWSAPRKTPTSAAIL